MAAAEAGRRTLALVRRQLVADGDELGAWVATLEGGVVSAWQFFVEPGQPLPEVEERVKPA